MVGAATRELANGLTEVATHFAAHAVQAGIWVHDSDGAAIAQGGACDRDGSPEFRSEGDTLSLHGLAKGRISVSRRLELPGDTSLDFAVTGDAKLGRDALQELASDLERAFESAAFRDYEAEDTTEHLLGLFEQIRAIHDLADQLPDCENFVEMGQLCLRALILSLHAKQGALVLRTPGREGLAMGLLMQKQGAVCEELEIKVRQDGQGPIDRVLRTGDQVYGLAEQFDIARDSLEATAEAGLLCVPISFGSGERQEILGCFLLLDREQGREAERPFGNPDAEVVESVSVLLGLIIGTRNRVQAEKELQIASTIQETLIPEHAPNWPGIDIAGRNRSANQVGGDYFDYVESDDGTPLVVIADVSGHNMASAMAMVMARTRLQAALEVENAPGRLMQRVCEGLFQDLYRNELFITFFCLSLEERTDEGVRIRYTNAGHNPPLLMRGDGSAEWLGGGGPMVGFLPVYDYEEEEVTLKRGDMVVLYTDGVTEAVSPVTGEMLEEAGLERIIRDLRSQKAQGVMDQLLAGLEAHTGAKADEDDITVVVLKVPEEDRSQS